MSHTYHLSFNQRLESIDSAIIAPLNQLDLAKSAFANDFHGGIVLRTLAGA